MGINKRIFTICVFIILLAFAGCGGGSGSGGATSSTDNNIVDTGNPAEYAGSYSGSWKQSDGSSGTWQLVIATNGSISGAFQYLTSYYSSSVSGSINGLGDASFASSSVAFSMHIDNGRKVLGNFIKTGSSAESGTFAGTRNGGTPSTQDSYFLFTDGSVKTYIDEFSNSKFLMTTTINGLRMDCDWVDMSNNATNFSSEQYEFSNNNYNLDYEMSYSGAKTDYSPNLRMIPFVMGTTNNFAEDIWYSSTGTGTPTKNMYTKRTVFGMENVTVPAGTFNALKVQTVTYTNSANPITNTYWYANGVGEVKVSFGGTSPYYSEVRPYTRSLAYYKITY